MINPGTLLVQRNRSAHTHRRSVSGRAESRDALFLERGDDLVERRASELLRVRREPLHDVEGLAGVERVRGDWVSVQVVGDIRLPRHRARTLSTLGSG